MCYLEYQAIGDYILSYYAMMIMFMQIFLVVSLQRNFSIDIFTSIIMAHYSWILAERFSHYLDVTIFKIPLLKRKLAFV